MIFQVALSLVLVVGALLTTRSLANLQNQNFGVATAQRVVMHFDPSGAGYTPDRVSELNRRLDQRFSQLPGVAHIGLAMYSPLEGDNWGECVIQEGHPAPGPHTPCGSSWDRVSTGFLDAVGVPIIRGRGFTQQDTATSPMVAVVNQSFVKRFFPNQDPIGQHFGIDETKYSGSFEIVGVFRDFKLNNPRSPVRPVFLRPMDQRFTGYQEQQFKSTEAGSLFMDAMVVNFSHAPASPDALLRRTLAEVDPNLIVADLRTFQAQIAGNFDQDRLIAGLAGLFALLALVLAAVGLYGVTAYLVARRTGEIGVRMALGASRAGVVRLVLRRVCIQAAIGLGLGIPAAVAAARLMSSQMYGIGAYDP
ncbi:MAG: ABC transporter permease, partial [Streptosporangiaceae bacterium]